MTLMRIAAAALLALALAGQAAHAEAPDNGAPSHPPVSHFRLANGLDVVVIEDHRAPVVTHMVWYRVGAADEPWGKSGIAHFLEHLMFKATDGLAEGEFSRIVSANGGHDNAFTGYDYTAYFQRIAADRLELVMSLEADRMQNLRLTEEAVETERAVILEERNQRTENNPQSLFGEQMSAALFQNHPYGIPVIGWRHEIEALDLADAAAFYERYYAPDNAILVVAGDVTPEDVRGLAEEHYGPIQSSGRPPDARPQEPPQRAPRRLEMRDARVSQPIFNREYLVPTHDPENPREAAALELLGDVLGRGITSRLARALEIDRAIAIETGAYYSAGRRDPGRFGVWAVPAEGETLATVEEAVDAVLAEVAAEGPEPDELARVKRLARAKLIYDQDDQAALARRYGSALASGRGVEDVHGWPEAIQAVTAEELRNAAGTYLVPERSVSGWLMTEKETGQ